MSRAFSSPATSPNDVAPAALMSSITGARSAARAFADADRACRALAQSAAVPGRPRKPPSRFPRALAAASAERVRSEINFASCSAMAAIAHAERRLQFSRTSDSIRARNSVPGTPAYSEHYAIHCAAAESVQDILERLGGPGGS